jgi:3-keto-5-aminohexanoate cleavage enzyme
MNASDARASSGDVVDPSRLLALFGDLATELLIRLDGDEGAVHSYDSIEFLAPVYVGDFLEATAEILNVGNTDREMRFEAKKVIANVRQVGIPPSAANVLAEPVVVCRALGTCVTPRELQRKPRELYMPQLPPGERPTPDAVVTPEGEGRGAGDRERTLGTTSTEVLIAAVLPGVGDVVQEAMRAREAGACILHLHAQKEDRLSDLIAEIRRRTDCIVQVSSRGLAAFPASVRRAESVTLACGSANHGSDVYVTPRSRIRELAAIIREIGGAPALECFEVGHVEEGLALADAGVLTRPLFFQLVLGAPGSIAATERNLRHLVGLMPPEPDANWAAAFVGGGDAAGTTATLTDLAMRLGGHPHVELDQVERVASYARSIGRNPVDPMRARFMMGLGLAKTSVVPNSNNPNSNNPNSNPNSNPNPNPNPKSL